MLVTINGKNCSAETPAPVPAEPYLDSGQEKVPEEMQIAADVETSGFARTLRWKRGKADTNAKSNGNPARYSVSRASIITNAIDLGYLQPSTFVSSNEVTTEILRLLVNAAA